MERAGPVICEVKSGACVEPVWTSSPLCHPLLWLQARPLAVFCKMGVARGEPHTPGCHEDQ